MGKLNFCDPQKCLKNGSKNGTQNDQKMSQKSAPKMTKKVTQKNDQKIPKIPIIRNSLLGTEHASKSKSLISLAKFDEWETPLGKVKMDTEFCQEIHNELLIPFDNSGFMSEHSISRSSK